MATPIDVLQIKGKKEDKLKKKNCGILIKKIPKKKVDEVNFEKMKEMDLKNYKKIINGEYNIEIYYEKKIKKKILIVPISDCCSISYIVQFKKYPFKNLKGKIIKGIYEINDKKLLKKNFKYIRLLKTNDDNWSYTSLYIYKIEIKNGDDMYFGLVNNSNGWYDGWIEIHECSNMSEL